MSRALRGALTLAVISLAAPAASGASPTQTIRLNKLGIAFRLPASWSGRSAGLRYDAGAPGGVGLLTVQEATTKFSIAVIGANFAKAELTQLKKTDPHATVVSQSVKLPVGAAVKVTVKYKGLWNTHRAAITHITYTFKRGTHAYIFDFGAPGTSLAKQVATFDAAIKSLHFLGAAAA